MSHRLPVLVAMLFAVLSTGCLAHHQGALPGEPNDASFLAVEGARVRYIDTKTPGPPVVLIHGFASSLNNWDAIVPELSKTHRVIALDLKGFGWTDRPEGDYSPEAQAKLVWELLGELGVDGEVDLVAHSWGSSVALQMTLDAPKRVGKIALYDAWVYHEQLPPFFLWSRPAGLGEVLFALFYKERPADKMELAFYDPTILSYEFTEHVAATLDRPGTSAAALAAVRGQDYRDAQTKYRTITQPVLLLWGREDRVTTLHFGERLHKDLRNSKLNVYPQCGHFPMIEAPASTGDLLDFLREDEHAQPAASAATSHAQPDVRRSAPDAAPDTSAPAPSDASTSATTDAEVEP